MLEQIQDSINKNPYLEKDIKVELFKLIVIFNNKFPNIKLDTFNKLVSTVKVGRISKYESRGTSIYDVNTNEILFSPNRLQQNYDVDNLFMQAVLGMITASEYNDRKFTGFDTDESLTHLNRAYTEIVADYLIGSGEVSDLEEEKIFTNQIGILIDEDTLFDAYFNNDGNKILFAITELCVNAED